MNVRFVTCTRGTDAQSRLAIADCDLHLGPALA